MKNLILTCSIIFSSIYMLSASNYAAHSTLTLLPNETSFIVDIDAFEGEVNYVALEDKSGKIIFTDFIESNKQRIKYVLDYLPADVYTVKVKGEDLVEYYVINITEETANILDIETYSSPTIVSQGNKIMVEVKNDSRESISLTILNKDDIVYSYSETQEGVFQKVFNLNKLANGNYRVLVSNDQFTKEVSITL